MDSNEVAIDGGQGTIRVDGLALQKLDASATRPVNLDTPTSGVFYRAIGNSGLSATATACVTHTGPTGNSVTVTVPAPQDGHAVVLLVHDPTGATSWHAPAPDNQPPAAVEFLARATDPPGSGSPAAAPGHSTKPVTFTLDKTRFTQLAESGTKVERLANAIRHFSFHPGVAGAKQLLTVLEYPVEHLVGWTAEKWFGKWEANKHPTVVRWFPPDRDHAVAGEPFSPTNWHDLMAGPALLFIHGIFSSCASAFDSVAKDQETLTALQRKYGTRMIGFDHPTASQSPQQNAQALLDQIPDNVSLDVDIVVHSRGGLVARELAALQQAAGADKRMHINRVVFAATPNGGSEITDTENLTRLVSRITSLLTMPASALAGPVGEITEILAGVLELVKVIGVGATIDLPGFEAMLPAGAYLAGLQERETAAYGGSTPPTAFAVAASFVPGPLLTTVFRHLDDAGRFVDDEVFAHAPNDIAVPTDGVWDPLNTNATEPAANSLFPVAVQRRLAIPQGDECWHCNYFAQPETRDTLVTWLTNDPPRVSAAPAVLEPAGH